MLARIAVVSRNSTISVACNASNSGRIVPTKSIGAWTGALPERRQSANREYWTTLLASIWALKKFDTNVRFRPLDSPFFTASIRKVHKKLFRRNRKSLCQLHDILQGRIPFSSFYPADVVAMQSRSSGQFPLRTSLGRRST